MDIKVLDKCISFDYIYEVRILCKVGIAAEYEIWYFSIVSQATKGLCNLFPAWLSRAK